MVKVCDTDPEGPVITISRSPGAELAGTVQWKVTKPVASAVCGPNLIAPGSICAETASPGANPNPYKVPSGPAHPILIASTDSVEVGPAELGAAELGAAEVEVEAEVEAAGADVEVEAAGAGVEAAGAAEVES